MERSGTAESWITFRSEHPWGAKLDGDENRCFAAGYLGSAGTNGSYVRIEGFEVTAFWAGFALYNGQNVVIANNHIHHLARYCTNSEYGMGVAVGGMPVNAIVENNVIHDNGRLLPGENGCVNAAYYENHDHGMYFHDSQNPIIRNNVFYNHLEGWAIHHYGGTASTGLQIVNNTFALKNPDRSGHIILANDALYDSVIANNLFCDSGNTAISFYFTAPSTIEIKNNMSDASTIAVDAYDVPLPTPEHSDGITISGNILDTPPGVVDVENVDFHLTAESSAIDSGSAIASVTADLDGIPRPQGAAHDIGAYEWKSGSAPSPPDERTRAVVDRFSSAGSSLHGRTRRSPSASYYFTDGNGTWQRFSGVSHLIMFSQSCCSWYSGCSVHSLS